MDGPFRHGRADLFDYTASFPAHYVPRALTFEAPERIWSDGPLDRAAGRVAHDVAEGWISLERARNVY